jgi:hypothetical protein
VQKRGRHEHRRITRTVVALASAVVISVSPLAAAPVALRGYNAAIGETSISGISSGAFMAVQFATAWSSVIKGVGVIAGGPFWCAKADADDFINGYMLPVLTATGSCMTGPPSDLDIFLAKAAAKAASGDIDSLQNLSRQKIYIFHGYNDAVVAKSVTDAAADFYRHYLGDTNDGNLYYQTAIGAGHSLVVLQEPHVNGLNDCKDNDVPYIDQCGYDQAGIVLQHTYGALNPPNRGQLTGTMMRFDQSVCTKPDDAGSLSLGDAGYVFVPKDCTVARAASISLSTDANRTSTISANVSSTTPGTILGLIRTISSSSIRRPCRVRICRLIRKHVGTGGVTSITRTAMSRNRDPRSGRLKPCSMH